MDRVKRECRNTSPSTLRTMLTTFVFDIGRFGNYGHEMAPQDGSHKLTEYCMIASGFVLRTRDVAAPFVDSCKTHSCIAFIIVVNCCLLVFQCIYIYIVIPQTSFSCGGSYLFSNRITPVVQDFPSPDRANLKVRDSPLPISYFPIYIYIYIFPKQWYT